MLIYALPEQQGLLDPCRLAPSEGQGARRRRGGCTSAALLGTGGPPNDIYSHRLTRVHLGED